MALPLSVSVSRTIDLYLEDEEGVLTRVGTIPKGAKLVPILVVPDCRIGTEVIEMISVIGDYGIEDPVLVRMRDLIY